MSASVDRVDIDGEIMRAEDALFVALDAVVDAEERRAGRAEISRLQNVVVRLDARVKALRNERTET